MKHGKARNCSASAGKPPKPEQWHCPRDNLLGVCPRALVGQQLKVWWPSDQRFYQGTVASYNQDTLRHKVVYEDGDEEVLLLVVESTQLKPSFLANAPMPSHAHLLALGALLEKRAAQQRSSMESIKTGRGRSTASDDARKQLALLEQRATEAYALAMTTMDSEQALPSSTDTDASALASDSVTACPTKPSCSSDHPAAKKPRLERSSVSSAPGPVASSNFGLPAVLSGSGAMQGLWRAPARLGPDVGPGTRFGPLYIPYSCPLVPVRQAQPAPQVQGLTAASGAGAEQAELAPVGAAAPGAAAPGAGSAAAATQIAVHKWSPMQRLKLAPAAPGPSGTAPVSAATEAATAQPGPVCLPATGDTTQDPGPGTSAAGASARVSTAEELRQGEAVRELYRRFCEASSSDMYRQYHELQVVLWLSPSALVGCEVRVLWPEDEAWFCGRVTRYDADTGTHQVEYDDGDCEELHMVVEQVRLQLVPGEELHPQHPDQLRAVAAKLLAAAGRLEASLTGTAGEDEGAKGVPKGAIVADAQELRDKAELLCERAGQLADVAAALEWQQLQQPCTRAASSSAPLPPPAPPSGAESAGALQAPAAAATDAAPEAPGTEAVGSAQAHAQELAVQALSVGQVVWGVINEQPPWPALVVTREEAQRAGLNAGRYARAKQPPVYVRFFGDYTVAALVPSSVGLRLPDGRSAGSHGVGSSSSYVAAFERGLNLGWHCLRAKRHNLKPEGRKALLFRQAMFELRKYLEEGELEAGMVPPNYDEFEDVPDEEAAAAEREHAGDTVGAAAAAARPAAHSTGRRGGSAGAAGAPAAQMPLVLGAKLSVHCLGRVEWLNDAFHTEKSIFPVGYRAARRMASGASGGAEVVHWMDIEVAADGATPVFRISPEGFPAVEADSATRAMHALYKDDKRTAGRAFARTGVDLFGLSHPRVEPLLRALPGAKRCERYCAWPEPGKPPVPPLSREEQVTRAALQARRLALPPGVQRVAQRKAGFCFECEVCGEDVEEPGNLKLECDLCRCVVHMECYGTSAQPDGSLWLCDVCQLHAAGLPLGQAPPCELCPVAGGPMKRTEHGGFCHVLCALWLPEAGFADPCSREPIEGTREACAARSCLKCVVCNQAYGACVQCPNTGCRRAFHPLCAREAGLAMVELSVGEEPGIEEEDEEHEAGTLDQGQGSSVLAGSSRQPHSGLVSLPPSKVLSVSAGAPATHVGLGGAHRVSSSATGYGPGPADTSAAGGTDASAVLVGGNKPPQQQQENRPGQHSSSFAECEEAGANPRTAAAAAVPRRPRRERRAGTEGTAAWLVAMAQRQSQAWPEAGHGTKLSLCFCRKHEQEATAPCYRTLFPGAFRDAAVAAARAARNGSPGTTYGASSSSPERHAAAAAAAGVCGPDPTTQVLCARLRSPDCSSSGRTRSYAHWRTRGLRAPETVAIATAKRTYMRQTPYLVTGRLQQQPEAVPPSTARQGLAASQRPVSAHLRPGVPACTAPVPLLAPPVPPAAGAAASGAGSSSMPREHATSCRALLVCGVEVRSATVRYEEMRSSVGRRLAAGRSAIHGWGAFAKVPHKKGDMLIEYAGELIRPSVSDVRERVLYNRMVGSGTYIFALNEAAHVDATRAGNMAHLLNHSCSPNCYSRTITLVDEASGTLRDHVIIIAKRDIGAWEELTYDYRFSGDQDLPCNCGAPSCRRKVNWLPAEEEAGGRA